MSKWDVCLELYVSFEDRDRLYEIATERGITINELLEEMIEELLADN